MSLLSGLERGTSPIDWCESNYTYSPLIAEYVNTVSNIVFLVFALLMSQLFKQYARTVNRGVYIVWVLFATVGICSAYFHATLSLVGQLLDELAILWVIAAAFALWLPRKHYPFWLNKNRRHFQYFILVLSVSGTFLSLIYPWINSFALMLLAVPTFLSLFSQLKTCRNARVKRLGLYSIIFWMFSVFVWISDRLFCDVWSALDFEYLHGLWHILSAITSNFIIVLFIYFDAVNEYEDKQPVLMFWPQNSFHLGVPYVILKNDKI